MKIIFCDCDGVINRISGEYSTPLRQSGGILIMSEPELVFRINLIVDRTDCELVLSSSWRHLPNWREVMKANGIVKHFLDRTEVETLKHGEHNGGSKKGGTYVRCRGNVIAAWLKEHPDVEKYAILDDDADFLAEQIPNFFQTDPALGLTQAIADAVERHLR